MALQPRSASGGAGDANGPPVSPEIRQMLHDVSADRIRQTIEKLVSFGTRHTLSSQADPDRGIDAATNWVFDQFQQDAATSDGRMTVEKQSFAQPPGPRNPNPVTVTNVIATLHGAQPESANRIYVVSGISTAVSAMSSTSRATRRGQMTTAPASPPCSNWHA